MKKSLNTAGKAKSMSSTAERRYRFVEHILRNRGLVPPVTEGKVECVCRILEEDNNWSTRNRMFWTWNVESVKGLAEDI